MSDMTDSESLRNSQYKDARNLDARIALHRDYSVNQYSFARWEFDHYLDLPADAAVLEVGCGPGTLWTENIDRIPDGWQITLSDFSPGMLAAARENLGDAQSRFCFRELDVQSIPLDDASLDAVIANHMLYHVPDLPSALVEIRRVLKPEGRLFAVTNGPKHLYELGELRKRSGQESIEQDWRSIGSLPFSLDNGAEILSPFFPKLTLDRYEDGLIVTEVAPLVAYLQSASQEPWPQEVSDALSVAIAQEMERQGGAIHISKETGMFIAYG